MNEPTIKDVDQVSLALDAWKNKESAREQNVDLALNEWRKQFSQGVDQNFLQAINKDYTEYVDTYIKEFDYMRVETSKTYKDKYEEKHNDLNRRLNQALAYVQFNESRYLEEDYNELVKALSDMIADNDKIYKSVSDKHNVYKDFNSHLDYEKAVENYELNSYDFSWLETYSEQIDELLKYKNAPGPLEMGKATNTPGDINLSALTNRKDERVENLAKEIGFDSFADFCNEYDKSAKALAYRADHPYDNVQARDDFDEKVAKGKANDKWNGSFKDFSKKQKETYYYMLGDRGSKAAIDYYQYVEYLIDQENSQLFAEELSDAAGEYGKAFQFLSSTIFNFASGLEYAVDTVNYLGGGPMGSNMFSAAGGMAREASLENFNFYIGDWNAGQFVGQTAGSLLDTVFSTAITGGYGGIALGLSAAAQGTNDALDRGLDNESAFWAGISAGVFEGVFESLSIGKFKSLQKAAVSSGWDIAKNIAKSMLVNASEEALTEIANIVYDTIANGDLSRYELLIKQYQNDGMSLEEARKKAASDFGLQVAEAAGSGALMGFGMAAAGGTVNYYKGARTAKKVYNSPSDMRSLINAGLKMNADTRAHSLATKYQAKMDSGDMLSGSEINKLLQAELDTYKTGDTTEIKARIESELSKLGQSENVSGTADIILERIKGNELSRSDKKILEQNKSALVVLSKALLGKLTVSTSDAKPGSAQNGDTAVDSGSVNGYNDGKINADETYRTEEGEIYGNQGNYDSELLGRRTVSTVGGSGNIVRSQSENTRKLLGWLGNSKDGSGTHEGKRAGSHAWLGELEGTTTGRLRHGESVFGDLRRTPLRPTDSAGRNLSDDLQEQLSETSMKDEDGTVLSLFHWTEAEFDEFEKGDIGFHFGTLDAAHNRRLDVEKSGKRSNHIYKEVYLNVKNPVFIDGDPITWDAFSASYKLNQIGVITDEEIKFLESLEGFNNGKYDSKASMTFREILQQKGYDGIVYTNHGEGGLSVIAFDADQIITVAENGVVKENSGVSEADSNGSASFMPDTESVPEGNASGITVNMSESRRAAVLRDKTITPVSVNDEQNADFDYDDLKSNIKSKVEKPLLKKFQSLGLLKKYKSVAISDVEFDFTGKGVRKSLHSQETAYGGSKADFTKMVIHLQELLDNAVLIETHTDKGKGTDREQRGLKQVYVLLSAMQDGNAIIPVQFEVKQYVDNNNRLYLAVALTKIETGVVGNTASEKQMATSLLPVSNISISELFSKINPKDKNFLKYVPDEFLNAEQLKSKKRALDEDNKKYGGPSDSSQIDQDADVENDDYAKDESFWTADNTNEDANISKTLREKLASLFGIKSDTKGPVSIGEIVKLIEKEFGVPVSTGRFRQRAYGIYKNKTRAIRTKIANALPTIAHELGHHLDKLYGLRFLSSISEAMEVLKTDRPDFYNAYKENKRPNESVAEFVRIYLADRALAKEKYPRFFKDFESVLNKSDLEKIRAIGDLVNKYYTASKVEAAKAAVLTRSEAKRIDRLGVRLGDMVERFVTQMVDKSRPIKKVSEKAYGLYTYSLKSAVRAKNSISGYYLSGLDGSPINLKGDEYKSITDDEGNVLAFKYLFNNLLSDVQVNDFRMYLIYKHGVEWLTEGKRVFADDSINNKQFMQDQIKELEQQNPMFKETAERVYLWQRVFMQEYAIKSGLVAAETMEKLNQKYPCYIPFYRHVEGKGQGVKVSIANQKSLVMYAKGSGLELYDPFENIIVQVDRWMKAADRNHVMQEIAKAADTEEGLGYLLEKVDVKTVPSEVSSQFARHDFANSMKEMLDKAEGSQRQKEAVLNEILSRFDDAVGDSITEFKVAQFQGQSYAAVMRNGKMSVYQIHDKNLLTAVMGLNDANVKGILKILGTMTRVMKALTTGVNAVWSLTSNSIRDIQSAFMYSSENNPASFTLDYIKAVGMVLKENFSSKTTQMMKLYKTAGGGFNNSLSSNLKTIKATVGEIFEKPSFKSRLKKALDIINFVENLSDAIETAPRLAEFKRSYDKTHNTAEALFAAEEITVNFNRSGAFGKSVDQVIPYFNASMQGLNKLATTLKNENGNRRAFAAKVITSAVLTTLLQVAFKYIGGDDGEEEYEKLSAYKKNNFYNFYLGNGKFFSVAKPKELGLIASFLERTVEISTKEDADMKREIEEYAGYVFDMLIPPLLDEAIMFGTIAELKANEDYKGSPIVSSYYQGLLPEDQYNEKTSYLARLLGEWFNYSPMKIDYIINSNFGVLGTINKSLFAPEKDLTLGIKSKFDTDSAYSTDVFNHFYDNADKASQNAKSNPNDMEAYYKNKQYTAAKSIVSALNQYGKDLGLEREYKIYARDYVDDFEKNAEVDERLVGILERTGDTDILYDKTFSATYSIDGVKHTIPAEEYLDYIDEYYAEIEEAYDDVLSYGYSDERTVAMLKQEKSKVEKALKKKYKTGE